MKLIIPVGTVLFGLSLIFVASFVHVVSLDGFLLAISNSAVPSSTSDVKDEDFLISERRVIAFVYNLTNPEETLQGQQAIVQEIGPISMNCKVYKNAVALPPGGYEVSYKLYLEYTIDTDNTIDVSSNIYAPAFTYFTGVRTRNSELFWALETLTLKIMPDIQDFLQEGADVIITNLSPIEIQSFISELQSEKMLSVEDILFDWANSTITDIADNQTLSGVPSAFLLCGDRITSSNISVASASALFNSAVPYSLTNADQAIWNPANVSQVLFILQQQPFLLSMEQSQLVVEWKYQKWNPFVETKVVQNYTLYGVQNKTDLPYLQWGTGNFGAEIQSKFSLPSWIFSVSQVTGLDFDQVSLNLQECKFVIRTLTNVTALFEEYNSLNSSMPAHFSTFIDLLLENYTYPMLGGQIFPADTIYNFLFGRKSSLYSFFHQGTVFREPGYLGDKAMPEYVISAPQEMHLTGKSNPLKAMWRETFRGESLLQSYVPGVVPRGTVSNFFGCNVDKSSSLLSWNDDFARETVFTYHKDSKTFGLDTYQFVLDRNYSVFQFGNKQYWNTIDGYYNISGFRRAPLYVHFPDILDSPAFLGDTDLRRSNTTVESYAPHYFTWEVEPFSGYGMKSSSWIVYSMMSDKFDFYGQNISGHSFPLLQLRSIYEMKHSDTHDVRHVLWLKNVFFLVSAIFWTVGAFLCVTGFVFVFIISFKK